MSSFRLVLLVGLLHGACAETDSEDVLTADFSHSSDKRADSREERSDILRYLAKSGWPMRSDFKGCVVVADNYLDSDAHPRVESTPVRDRRIYHFGSDLELRAIYVDRYAWGRIRPASTILRFGQKSLTFRQGWVSMDLLCAHAPEPLWRYDYERNLAIEGISLPDVTLGLATGSSRAWRDGPGPPDRFEVERSNRLAVRGILTRFSSSTAIQEIDGVGYTFRSVPGASGRNLERRAVDGVADLVIHYTFDSEERVVAADLLAEEGRVPSGFWTWAYDDSGRLVRDDFDDPETTVLDYKAVYSYDDEGRLTSVEAIRRTDYPVYVRALISRDQEGYLVSEHRNHRSRRASGQTSEWGEVIEYTYHCDGPRPSEMPVWMHIGGVEDNPIHTFCTDCSPPSRTFPSIWLAR